MTEKMEKSFSFLPELSERVLNILARYPAEHKASALMPLLDIAQRQNGGWLTADIIDYVSDYVGVPRIRGHEVATFYTMYQHKSRGQYHVQVCTTTPCWLRGSADIVEACQRKLNIRVGETSADGKFGLSEAECLGACVNAPVVQINDDYFEDLSPESMSAILEKLSQDERVTPGSQIQRQGSAPQGASIPPQKARSTSSKPINRE